jgi:hypothetical protein
MTQRLSPQGESIGLARQAEPHGSDRIVDSATTRFLSVQRAGKTGWR